MNKWSRVLLAFGLVFGLVGFGSTILAQEADEDETAPEVEAKKRHFGLFVSVAAGMASTDDLDTSIDTSVSARALNTVSLDEQERARAAVGWRLAEGKGDVRLVFNGYKETEYEFRSQGVPSSAVLTNGQAIDLGYLTPWWDVSIVDGRLRSTRTDNLFDQGTSQLVRTVDLDFSRNVTDDLQNQLQTVDALYGREFGGRRFSSHWWAGLRYFEFTGNLPAAAWVNLDTPGDGFTDGSLVRLLNFSEEAKGWGPTGAWEVDFNFFDKGVVLYASGQVALVFESLESDSGTFFTLVQTNSGGGPQPTPAPARLVEERDKSAWHNSGEVGVRFMLRNGLQFELGYTLTGYLDAALRPNRISIPNLAQVDLAVTALYNTQDYIVDGWHAGVAFQF